MPVSNIISFDIEEIFHGEYTRHLKNQGIAYRTGKNIDKVLDILDEHNVKATFFVVGELVDIFPDLLEKIAGRGHEIGFHTYDHIPVWNKTPESFSREILAFKQSVQKAGKELKGFRAPSFSIDQSNRWALDVLRENGLSYDSSIFPAKTQLYGVKGAPDAPYFPDRNDLTKREATGLLMEYPVLVWRWGPFTIPSGGGFFLRTLPLWLVKKAIRSMNGRGYPAVLYVHNWELDDGNPSLDLNFKSRFVVYNGIRSTERKLHDLLSSFSFTSFEGFRSRNAAQV